MTTMDRQDVQGVACPDCGAAVYREFHGVAGDGRPGSVPTMGHYGCHGEDCGWRSPDKPVSPGHLSLE